MKLFTKNNIILFTLTVLFILFITATDVVEGIRGGSRGGGRGGGGRRVVGLGNGTLVGRRVGGVISGRERGAIGGVIGGPIVVQRTGRIGPRRRRPGNRRRRWYGNRCGYRYAPPPTVYYNSWWNPYYWLGNDCKEGCTKIDDDVWGCPTPGNGPNDCVFATDCYGCEQRNINRQGWVRDY